MVAVRYGGSELTGEGGPEKMLNSAGPAQATPTVNAVPQLVKVRTARLQHEHVVQTDGRAGKLGAACAEREMAFADRGFLQHLLGLHQDLDGQPGGEDLHQHGVLGRIDPARCDADEVVRKRRHVRGSERARIELREQWIMIRLDVASVGLELGDRHRLGQLEHLRQAVAERLHGARAVVEQELVGPGVVRRLLSFRRSEEPLRPEHRERALDALPAALGQVVSGAGPAQQVRHRRKVEYFLVRTADGGLEAFRAPAFFRVDERSPENVGEFHRQRARVRMERARFLDLHLFPEVPEHARRQLVAAVEHLAVRLECRAGVLQNFPGRLVRAGCESGRGERPQFGQPPGRTLRDECANFALEPQHVFSQPFSFDAPRRDLPQDLVDHAGERLYRSVAGGVFDQHDREVVAQPGEIAKTCEQRRAQVQPVDGVELPAVPLARQMKHELLLETCGHVHVGQPVAQAAR